MDIYLLIVTLLAIAIVILGVSWWKWHAFISLTVASLFLAIMSGLNLTKIVTAYETGNTKVEDVRELLAVVKKLVDQYA